MRRTLCERETFAELPTRMPGVFCPEVRKRHILLPSGSSGHRRGRNIRGKGQEWGEHPHETLLLKARRDEVSLAELG